METRVQNNLSEARFLRRMGVRLPNLRIFFSINIMIMTIAIEMMMTMIMVIMTTMMMTMTITIQICSSTAPFSTARNAFSSVMRCVTTRNITNIA